MTLLRKLVGPGEPWKLVEHFLLTSVVGILVLGGLMLALAGTGPPLVTERVTPPNPIEIVLDPPIPATLAPIPMQGR